MISILLRLIPTRTLIAILSQRRDWHGFLVARGRVDIWGTEWVWRCNADRTEALWLLEQARGEVVRNVPAGIPSDAAAR